ncbi:hypothetical protein CkaCkLH20_05697 [Colletotrichum karsti]|uniref:RGS domain-containing protein n=1 Tax=Colletotrichum karsti TaxID=1095194 RepID=A0A9P6I833_9PEZI|nr:uncharacterized protein CkaCkLH20_05697 [Colletotrichum karsti]KAF9876851.1 hypothetical protein CkaCkLH20_05697 [Colletotrichum karsti]
MDSGSAATSTPSAAPAAAAPAFNSEPASLFWLAWGGFWTVLLLCGMAFLFVNRQMPFLRIRGLALSFGAVTMLHLYWISVQIGLAIGQYVPDGAEFWVMGLYLPFGIALFHASNSRFLHVAKAQKRYAGKPAVLAEPEHKTCNCRDKTLVGRFRKLDYSNKMLVVVCTGMLLQLLLTVFMYLISRKYHPWFGIPGTEAKGTPEQQKVEMGRGWEWWPSVFWQFFWAWLIAPVILWKSRGIKDTQGWRLQTIACCVSSLHATPMWLVALYVPEMAPVNRYFIPPQWICLSITFIEIFTIFVPCWQVIKHQTLRQETLESIAIWEAKNRQREARFSFITDSTRVASSSSTTWKSLAQLEKDTSQSESVFTMGALEYVLDKNPEPLRKFSALRDFSGENIAFLSAVCEWKSSIPQTPRSREGRSAELTRERFNRALNIYTEFISPRHAEFQINIASQDLKNLENIFEDAAQILYGRQTERFSDPVVPFEDPNWSAGPESPVSPTSSRTRVSQDGTLQISISDRVQYWGKIPESFTASVFDDAETSIKYLVLTNTWPKFVKERRYSLDSEDSGDTVETFESTSTLTRVVRYFRAMRA